MEIKKGTIWNLRSHRKLYLNVQKENKANVYVDPFHPSINEHILHTVLYTFPKMLTRRICLKVKSFFNWRSFPLFFWPRCLVQGWYCKEKLDAWMLVTPQASQARLPSSRELGLLVVTRRIRLVLWSSALQDHLLIKATLVDTRHPNI